VSEAAIAPLSAFTKAWAGWHRSWCALTGICCSLVGLSVGTYRHNAEPKLPEIDAKAYVAERLFSKATGKESASYTARTKQYEKARADFAARRDLLSVVEKIAGVTALLFGIAAVVRRENARMVMFAVGLGVSAIFFDMVLVVLAIVLIGSLISSLTC
jgi:hypothetical protein